jgi:isopentenyl-diphosphate Delta-isomerase
MSSPQRGIPPAPSAIRPARDRVVLVDEEDRPLGTAPKLEAHQSGGRLHRAFSVYIFDSAGRMLLQRRAAGKYHFAGLWTNACCSHPQPDEPVADAARARLREEFGFDAELTPAFTFTYRATDPASGLTEHEFDHVFFGRFDGEPLPAPAEIGEWRWIPLPELAADVKARPERYTPWFRIALDEVLRRRGCTGRQDP